MSFDFTSKYKSIPKTVFLTPSRRPIGMVSNLLFCLFRTGSDIIFGALLSGKNSHNPLNPLAGWEKATLRPRYLWGKRWGLQFRLGRLFYQPYTAPPPLTACPAFSAGGQAAAFKIVSRKYNTYNQLVKAGNQKLHHRIS